MKLTNPPPKVFLKQSEAKLLISPGIKKLWSVQLDLLALIDKICRQHSIRYSVDSGTLIGAMRHGGYVPWDDDIDVVMPRADYERFASIVTDELPPEYFFQTAENSPGYYRPFARILNLKTKAYLKSEFLKGMPLWKYPQGVFVDILIADNVPEGKAEQLAHESNLKRLQHKYWMLRTNKGYFLNFSLLPISLPYFYKAAIGLGVVLLEKLHIRLLDYRFNRFLKELKKFNGKPSACVAPYVARMYETLRADDFDNLIDVDFEYLKVKAFARYDEILSGQYGDWHKHVIGAKAPMIYDLKEVDFDD